MKFFRYSVLAIALAAGFASCSDDDDPVLGPQSPGVYFPTDDALEVTLDRKANTFEVTVSRLGETPEVTYNLVGEADEEVFTLPTSVKFAEGETTTKVSIAYDQDAMKLDKAYDVLLGFAEGTVISDYGYSSLEMAVTLPAPWKTIGTGTYHDCWLLAMTSLSEDPEFKPEWECELQQNEITPTRYRWVHPYGENFAKFCAANGVGTLDDSEYDSKGQYYVEFVCDPKYGKAVIPLQSLGFQFFSDGVMNILNDAYYIMASENKTYAQVATEDPESCAQVTYGKVKEENENGEEVEVETILSVFSNDKTCLAGFEGSSSLYYAGSGYNWVREGIEIKDYNISIAYKGVLTTPNEVTNAFAEVTLGEDIATAKAGMVAVTDENVTLESAIAGVIDGTIPSKTIEDKKSSQTFAFEGGGHYIIAVVGYDKEDKVVASNAIEVEIIDNSGPKEWTNVGMGTYTDMFVLPLFGARGYSWQVQVQQNTEDPTIYRWVHPYGSAFKALADQIFEDPWEADQYDSANVMYMNFVVQDGLVAIPTQLTGVVIDNGTIGQLSAANQAGMYYASDWTFDDILRHPQLGESKFNTATFNGDKLTSVVQPANNTCLMFETDEEGQYHTLKTDEGGVQWASAAMQGAPVRMPSLKAAYSINAAVDVKNARMNYGSGRELRRDLRLYR